MRLTLQSKHMIKRLVRCLFRKVNLISQEVIGRVMKKLHEAAGDNDSGDSAHEIIQLPPGKIVVRYFLRS